MIIHSALYETKNTRQAATIFMAACRVFFAQQSTVMNFHILQDATKPSSEIQRVAICNVQTCSFRSSVSVVSSLVVVSVITPH
ncbi:MAG: hypothetical protein LUG55_02505 [Clostridiales bacterium]|nr:hypothetical protein [Clostridiales bacterium]